MLIHENRLLADDSHEISYLLLFEKRKDVAKVVVCCSSDCDALRDMTVT